MTEPHSESSIIHIRSKDCTELTTGFNTHLKVPGNGNLLPAIQRKIGHQLHVSISSAEIPYTFYNVTTHLKSNQIEVDGAASLQLPDGNYDIYDLVTDITADATFPFSMTFDRNTYKVKLTNTSGGNKTLNFDSQNSRELAKMLGFDREETEVLSGATITAQGVVNLRPVHSIFLHSDLATTNVYTTENNGIENILDKIPLGEVGYGQIITYDPYESAPFSSVVDVEVVSLFEISLRDQNGELIQLNGTRYEISLLIEQKLTYDHETNHPANPYPEISSRRRINSQEQPISATNTTIKPETRPQAPDGYHYMPDGSLMADKDMVEPVKPNVIPPSTRLMRMPSSYHSRVAPSNKRARKVVVGQDHLDKQEIDLQNALLMASTIVE